MTVYGMSDGHFDPSNHCLRLALDAFFDMIFQHIGR
jgi:hypothetical protein